MFKKIVVPIDESKTANDALNTAIQLAEDQQAKLYILHVIDYVNATAGAENINVVALRENIKKAGEELLNQAEILAAAKGIKAEKKLITYNGLTTQVADKIVVYAKKRKADLIVIGTHGRRGIKRMLLGSVAENVIRKTTLPVLLIHDNRTK